MHPAADHPSTLESSRMKPSNGEFVRCCVKAGDIPICFDESNCLERPVRE